MGDQKMETHLVQGVPSPVDKLDRVVVKRFEGETGGGPQWPKLSHLLPKVQQGVGGLGHPSLTFVCLFFISVPAASHPGSDDDAYYKDEGTSSSKCKSSPRRGARHPL